DGEVSITFVPAVHSSQVTKDPKQPGIDGGAPGGFVVAIKGGPTLYHTGDTDVFGDMALADLEEAEWDRILGTNLKAAYLLIHAALPALARAPRGRILNVSSIHGTVGDANVVAHCAAKFGLVGLTKALARELRGAGIAVNAVCPGSTENKGREEAPRPHEAPLREKLNAEDVAGAALFLVSPAAASISGAVLDVWGGTYVAIHG
ncbi:MAG TPA: SDR family oxidoreductase, partial [Thermoanaerobaculia bacterium]|nr:SDR family oxidoreductase [Thermoanaerobaculia bacterium]